MAKMHFKKQPITTPHPPTHHNNNKKDPQHNPTETKTRFYSLLDIENQQPQYL